MLLKNQRATDEIKEETKKYLEINDNEHKGTKIYGKKKTQF